MTDYLSAGFELKSVDTSQRTISGYASVFGNVDRASDIVDHKAFDRTLREKLPADILVTIGHKVDDLPVGVPTVIRPDAKGLYTETRIFNTRAGDDLLQTARELLAHGQTLGMSFIYNTREAIRERTAEGKAVRRLMDLDLIEITYGARQAAINQSASVIGVKQQGGAMRYRIEQRGDQFAVIDTQDGDVESTHPTRAAAEARMRALMSGKDPGDREKMDEAEYESKAVWDTAYVNDLPDSAFLFVESGTKDEEGKTVPRSKRHFPYKDAGGKIDLPHLRDAIGRIPQSNASGLNKDALQARARRLLDQANGGGKMDDESPEWKLEGGAPLRILSASQKLADIANEVVDAQRAMRLLGEDTKAGRRMQGAMREKLKAVAQALADVISWAEMADSGEEGAAKIRHYRAELERLRL